MGIQALAAYATLVRGGKSDLTVKVTAGALVRTININAKNAAVLQTVVVGTSILSPTDRYNVE